MSTRADLKRAYRDRERQAGVYKIENTANGKVLLASAMDLHGPLNRHRFALRAGGHPNRQLQLDWNAFGEEAFVFEVLEVVTKRDDPEFSVSAALSALEKRWLEKLQPFSDRGYNARPHDILDSVSVTR